MANLFISDLDSLDWEEQLQFGPTEFAGCYKDFCAEGLADPFHLVTLVCALPKNHLGDHVGFNGGQIIYHVPRTKTKVAEPLKAF